MARAGTCPSFCRGSWCDGLRPSDLAKFLFSFLLDHIREHGPRSLKVCALIDRPGERKVEVRADWALFTLESPKVDDFLVGYGLDYAESYRGLPYIGVIHRPAPTRGEPRGGEGQ